MGTRSDRSSRGAAVALLLITARHAHATCAPATVLTYSAPALDLLCGANNTQPLFDVAIPGLTGTSRALGRVTLQVEGRAAVSNVTHFWNCIVYVGGSFPAGSANGVGDDVCPGTITPTKSSLGYGTLSAEHNNTVSVKCYQGASPCVDRTNRIVTGASLQVFVEDPAPACRESSVFHASYYSEPNAYKTFWEWPAEAAPLLELTVEMEPAGAWTRRTASLFSVAEATVWNDPNDPNFGTGCGQRWPLPSANVVTQLVAANQIFSTARAVFPAAEGMGHVVVSNAVSGVALSSDANTTVRLLAGRNFSPAPRDGHTLTTGGQDGGAVLAVVIL